MAKRKRPIGCLVALFAVAALGGGGFSAWQGYVDGLRPARAGKPRFFRIESGSSIDAVFQQLQTENVVRSARSASLWVSLNRKSKFVAAGSYLVEPGMTIEQVYASLQRPIVQKFRFPETNWARRSANLLEKAKVTTAESYLEAIAEPAKFQPLFDIPLPKQGTMEGFLFPDTYELPPEIGAEQVILRQLKAFQSKVMPHIKNRETLYRTLIIASLVELEVARDDERAIVAGVIENRLRKNMPLQIDATVNYALQEWRPLTYADLKVDLPHNTYRNKGLPPTPICSPSLKSIKAALAPSKHNYLYYVAMPDKYHLFSATFDEHRANIAKRKAAIKKLQTP